MNINYFELAGLILNLGSAILLSFSTEVIDPAKGTGGAIQFFGHNLTITTIKRKRFVVGLVLLSLGFVLQLFGIFYV